MRFFSPEAGQRRRTALEQLVSGVEQFIPPNLRPAAEAVVQMNPVQGISDAMSASGVVFDPEQTAEARRRAAVDMGVEMAMTLAPAALVRMGYLAAPAGLMETFATPSVDAAVDMGRNALSDAQYAVRSIGEGDFGGVFDALRPGGQPQSLSAAIPVYQGRSRQNLDEFFNPQGVSWGTNDLGTAELFAGKSELSELYPNYPGQVYNLEFDLNNPMDVDISETLWSADKEMAKVAEAKAAGHDGLRIMHPSGKIDYVAFDPSQVKQVGDATPKSAPTFEEAPMIVQHNISPQGLAISDQIGGIPMPSIGIAGAKAPLENFGDITLLLDPNKIAPRRDLPVYPADAYTGRQPRADVEFVNQDATEKAISSDPKFSHMKDIDYWMMSYDNFADNDRMMRTAQFGIDQKIADPKDYERFDDFVRDVQRKSGGFIYEEQLEPYSGLREYGDTQLMIAPKDPYTPSGNRRKSKPYTVEEAFKRMRQSGASEAGAEQHSGAGQLRAVLLDKFKNLDEIKSKRGLLMPSGNEMEDIKGSFDTMAYDEVNDLAAKHFDGRFRLAEDYLTDLAMGRNTSYADATPEARDAARAALARLKEEVKNMPTEYFEAKPRSVAQIGDFDAAIVPEGNQEALEILRRAGVKDVRTYNNDTTGQTRGDVIRQFKDLMFAVPAGGLLAYNMLPQQQALPNDQGLLY